MRLEALLSSPSGREALRDYVRCAPIYAFDVKKSAFKEADNLMNGTLLKCMPWYKTLCSLVEAHDTDANALRKHIESVPTYSYKRKGTVTKYRKAKKLLDYNALPMFTQWYIGLMEMADVKNEGKKTRVRLSNKVLSYYTK